MSKETAQKKLQRAFEGLTKRQLENLLWHYNNRTPVLCGKEARESADGKGGG